MPIGLKISTKNISDTEILFCTTTPGHETEEIELPVTNLKLEIVPGGPPVVIATFLASDLGVELEAVKLLELASMGRAPHCIYCKEKMVRTHYQNEEGDWFVCYLCGCEPDPEVCNGE